jgi:hypothetical protein
MVHDQSLAAAVPTGVKSDQPPGGVDEGMNPPEVMIYKESPPCVAAGMVICGVVELKNDVLKLRTVG